MTHRIIIWKNLICCEVVTFAGALYCFFMSHFSGALFHTLSGSPKGQRCDQQIPRLPPQAACPHVRPLSYEKGLWGGEELDSTFDASIPQREGEEPEEKKPVSAAQNLQNQDLVEWFTGRTGFADEEIQIFDLSQVVAKSIWLPCVVPLMIRVMCSWTHFECRRLRRTWLLVITYS